MSEVYANGERGERRSVTGMDIEPAVDRTVPIIGTVLGGTYRILRPLAGGGCGEVYLAKHERLGSDVAVKVLHPSWAGNAQALSRLRREADIMASVRHPHIVQILDFDVTEWGVPFLVMELLDGHPLTEGAVSGKPLEPRAALHIIDQIAQALGAAHAHGIVHLDLKPDNVILVSTDGRDDFVKVIDFGISRATWRELPANEPLVTGTPEYMAPEQIQGLSSGIDHRADQFALASLSYRLLTGQEPFAGADLSTILHHVMNDTQQPPSQRVPLLGANVDAVLDRGMAKRSADRYPSVAAFGAALRDAIGVIAVDRRVRPRGTSPRTSGEVRVPPLPPANPKLAASPPASDPGRLVGRARRLAPGRRGSTAVLVVLVVMCGWLSPTSRATARMLWVHGGGEARRVLAVILSRSPSRR